MRLLILFYFLGANARPQDISELSQVNETDDSQNLSTVSTASISESSTENDEVFSETTETVLKNIVDLSTIMSTIEVDDPATTNTMLVDNDDLITETEELSKSTESSIDLQTTSETKATAEITEKEIEVTTLGSLDYDDGNLTSTMSSIDQGDETTTSKISEENENVTSETAINVDQQITESNTLVSILDNTTENFEEKDTAESVPSTTGTSTVQLDNTDTTMKSNTEGITLETNETDETKTTYVTEKMSTTVNIDSEEIITTTFKSVDNSKPDMSTTPEIESQTDMENLSTGKSNMFNVENESTLITEVADITTTEASTEMVASQEDIENLTTTSLMNNNEETTIMGEEAEETTTVTDVTTPIMLTPEVSTAKITLPELTTKSELSNNEEGKLNPSMEGDEFNKVDRIIQLENERDNVIEEAINELGEGDSTNLTETEILQAVDGIKLLDAVLGDEAVEEQSTLSTLDFFDVEDEENIVDIDKDNVISQVIVQPTEITKEEPKQTPAVSKLPQSTLRIQNQPQSTEIFLPGSVFALQCEANSKIDIDIAYSWTKNGRFMDLSGPRVFLESDKKGNLIILNPRGEDEGLYQCAASNSEGVVFSRVIKVESKTYARKLTRIPLRLGGGGRAFNLDPSSLFVVLPSSNGRFAAENIMIVESSPALSDLR